MKNGVRLEKVFGAGGLLSAKMPKYEHREGQQRMASLVTAAFQGGKNLIVEAGTGIGKTLAYLFPAVELNNRVLIATGTKNLQEQLFYKDLPLLREILGAKIDAVLVKGRANYLCLKRVGEFEERGTLKSRREIDYFKTIRIWSSQTRTGDIAGVDGLPENLTFWNDINARSEICLGTKCPLFQDCFITKLKRRTAKAKLILTNHHLLFADLSLKIVGQGDVLPDYKYLIVDEAHLVANAAGGFFGVRISDYQFRELIRDLRWEMAKNKINGREIEIEIAELGTKSNELFGLFREEETRFRIDELKEQDHVFLKYDELRSSLSSVSGLIKKIAKECADLEPLVTRIAGMSDNLSTIIKEKRKDNVYWAEHGKRALSLYATPLDVSNVIRTGLFEQKNSVVLTSATLTIAGKFDHLVNQLGIPDVTSAIIESAFDFKNNARLYIPKNLPLPSEPDFYEELSKRAEEILEITKGRALLLFTSYSGMQKCFDILNRNRKYEIFKQGDDNKSALLERFRSERNCVLLATMSFWQGVDIQGEDLLCVIVDKLPFSVPTEPIIAAKIEYIKSNGGNPFYDFQVPTAATYLKQGLGRLIRHSDDYGLAAVMDKRIIARSYGRIFLASLPPFQMAHSIKEVMEFFCSFETV